MFVLLTGELLRQRVLEKLMRSCDQSGGHFCYMSPKNVSSDHADMSSGHFPSLGGGCTLSLRGSPSSSPSP